MEDGLKDQPPSRLGGYPFGGITGEDYLVACDHCGSIGSAIPICGMCWHIGKRPVCLDAEKQAHIKHMLKLAASGKELPKKWREAAQAAVEWIDREAKHTV